MSLAKIQKKTQTRQFFFTGTANLCIKFQIIFIFLLKDKVLSILPNQMESQENYHCYKQILSNSACEQK